MYILSSSFFKLPNCMHARITHFMALIILKKMSKWCINLFSDYCKTIGTQKDRYERQNTATKSTKRAMFEWFEPSLIILKHVHVVVNFCCVFFYCKCFEVKNELKEKCIILVNNLSLTKLYDVWHISATTWILSWDTSWSMQCP